MLNKAFAITLIFIGEILSIGAELVGSKRAAAENASPLALFFSMFVVITIAGACLVGGYMLGYVALKNIWIVTAVSIGSILIVEPILAVLIFHQTPTVGATVGLALGFLGIIASLTL